MGDYWLHKAEEPLKAALGAKFKPYLGYRTRCRSTGGFNDIRGIVMHHDADNTSGEDDWVLRYEYETAIDGPIGNFHVQRNGDVWFGAAGASNHAGKGGPVSTSRGTVPLNQGNLYLIGIEASNNGVGEVWPRIQLDCYLILVTVLCKTFNLDPLTDIYGHWTWCEPSCPGRKIDPRGPTPSYPKFGGTSGTNKWNMQEVCKEVNARVITSPPPEPSEEDMAISDEDVERIATRAAQLVWAQQVSTTESGVKSHGWVAGQNYTATLRAVAASEEAAANTRE